jgi:carbohydrate diacid regulator
VKPAYEESLKAAKVAEKGRQIIFYEDLLLEIILEEVSIQTKEEFTERILKNLYKERDLLLTLISFLKNNQSIKETANELHIHINTLHYRLRQIKDFTGIDPKETEGITLFYVALSLSRDLL